MSQPKTQKQLGKYLVTKTIGKGILKVKLVVDPETNKQYAAKICKSAVRQACLEREAAILRDISKVNLPNIVKTIEYIENDSVGKSKIQASVSDSDSNLKPYNFHSALIMELASNNTVFDYMFFGGNFDEKLARTYFKKVLETVDNLHVNGFVHRDLKPENLLLDDKFEMKLADFGFAKGFDNMKDSKMNTRLGTECYMAPEMHVNGDGYLGTKVDVFACGVLLFLFVLGRPPFFKANSRDPFYKHIIAGTPEKFWGIYEDKLNKGKLYDKNLKDLINALLAFEADKRPTPKEAMNFEWMKGETYTPEQLIEVMGSKKDIVDKEVAKQKF
jgi:serine/threonine protein kinase